MSILNRALGITNRARLVADQIRRSDRSNYPHQVAVFAPNNATVEFIGQTKCRFIAEIGIYKGHTSLKFAEFLNGDGELHLFDFEDRVADVERKLRKAGYHNVRTFGSSYKLLDSYNWSLGMLLASQTAPIYDYIFLDGAHTWAVDALTTFLADRLLRPGGYLDFDDYDWSLGNSPTLKPSAFPLTKKLYTDEQIAAKQVKMVVELIVRRNPSYREVVPNKIFQKITE